MLSHTLRYLTWKKKEEIYLYFKSQEREEEKASPIASCMKRDDGGSYLQYVYTRVRPIKTPFKDREEHYDELLHIKWSRSAAGNVYPEPKRYSET